MADLETDSKLKKQFCLHIRDRALSQALYGSENYNSWSYTDACTRAQNLQGTALACQSSYSKGINNLSAYDDHPAAVAALSTSNRSSIRCYYCNNVGHVQKECRKKAAAEKTNRNPATSNQYRDNNHRGNRGGGRGNYRGRGTSRGRGRGRNNFGNSNARVASLSTDDNSPKPDGKDSSAKNSSSSAPNLDSISNVLESNYLSPLFEPPEGNE